MISQENHHFNSHAGAASIKDGLSTGYVTQKIGVIKVLKIPIGGPELSSHVISLNFVFI